ncbi:LysE family translocator [Acinetobacter gerneri]|uniref:LysE family translocator n=1 Tax=Acinetobacter gerneri TaxID=202952 RepID=UPI003214732D
MELFIAIAITHFLALLSPGPDFFLILSTLLRQGQRSAKMVCLGVATGNALIILLIYLSLFCLGKLNPDILNIVHYAGAAYLLYLAIQCFRYANKKIDLTPVQPDHFGDTSQQILNFFKGLQSSILNPKNFMFYSSLLVLVFYQYQGLTLFGLSFWMVAVVLFWNLLLVCLLTQKAWLDLLIKKSSWLFYLSSGCFLIFAILLLCI